MSYPDPTSVRDVQQLDEPESLTEIPVCIDDPVDVHILPSRIGATHNYLVDTTVQPLLGEDLRRRRVVIISVDNNIYVGDRESVENKSACIWPKAVPLVMEHCQEIYVATDTGTSTVSLISENWAD